jgi:hypothetical protein
VDRTQRIDCGRFISRHTRTEQVRDGNRRDDQNDRHDDLQFDKRETLLILLHFPISWCLFLIRSEERSRREDMQGGDKAQNSYVSFESYLTEYQRLTIAIRLSESQLLRFYNYLYT